MNILISADEAKERDEKVLAILFNNAKDFLNEGLNKILVDKPTQLECKFAVTNIQTALELLAKWRLVRAGGLQAILLTPGSASLLASANVSGPNGPVTQKYWQVREVLEEIELSNSQILERSKLGNEANLLTEFQQTRNSILHFGLELDVEKTISSCAAVVSNVVRRLLSEDSTEFSSLLAPEVYNKLISFEPYITNAFDQAHNYTIGREIVHCFECRNKTMVNSEGYFYCFACGVIGDVDMAGYLDCPFCKGTNSFVYDRLNDTDGIHMGKCLVCREESRIGMCEQCGTELFVELPGSVFVDPDYRCDSC